MFYPSPQSSIITKKPSPCSSSFTFAQSARATSCVAHCRNDRLNAVPGGVGIPWTWVHFNRMCQERVELLHQSLFLVEVNQRDLVWSSSAQGLTRRQHGYFEEEEKQKLRQEENYLRRKFFEEEQQQQLLQQQQYLRQSTLQGQFIQPFQAFLLLFSSLVLPLAG